MEDDYEIATQLMALPKGIYRVHCELLRASNISWLMQWRGAKNCTSEEADILADFHGECSADTYVITDDLGSHFDCTLAYLANCKMLILNRSSDYHYRVDGNQLIKKDTTPPFSISAARIDEGIEHTKQLIADLRDTLRKLEDLHFKHAKKPAAKKLADDRA